MTRNDNLRLCGGTFFCLLLQAKKQRKNNRPQIRSDNDGLTESGMFEGLIKVFQPNYIVSNKSAFCKVVSNYKLCKPNSLNNLPFADTIIVDNFDDVVKNNYSEVSKRMSDFTDKFIDIENKAEWLVKAMLELMDSDKNIPDKQDFYILPDGGTLSKLEMLKTSEFCFETFLAGIFHYILVKKIDNNVGIQTIDIFYSEEEKYKSRKFISNIGKNFNGRVYLMNTPKIDENIEYSTSTESAESKIVVESEQKNYSDAGKSYQQNVNKPVVFNINQYGENNTQIGSY